MKPMKFTFSAAAATAIFISMSAVAGVTPQEAATLKSSLTPMGAERAANAAKTIPAWTGAALPASAGGKGSRRADPFASEKPLYSVTSKNLAQYANLLSEGQQAMLKKYPEYRIDVYPTHRTAVAPQWVYENTFKNATRASAEKDGEQVVGAYGGIPFPIPKTGKEAMWNHMLSWQGETYEWNFRTYFTTADGKRVFSSDSTAQVQEPYYFKDGSPETFKGEFETLRLVTNSPAMKAGEAILYRDNLDLAAVGRQSWQYLTGQRRVRKLPNALYDTPSFVSSGVGNFDEVYVYSGPMDRYEWKIVGKREMLVPYNGNKLWVPTKDSDVMSERFMNPDHMRWELHRVWVIEANLAPGKRHVMAKRKFYLDEDTWMAVLADGWDAKGQLWKSWFHTNIIAPELPGVIAGAFGHYNLQTGGWIVEKVMNEKPDQVKSIARLPDRHFSPDALAGEGIR